MWVEEEDPTSAAINPPLYYLFVSSMFMFCFFIWAGDGNGIKALNHTTHSSPSRASAAVDSIAVVTVFTIYNSSTSNGHVEDQFSNLVTVGNASYTKFERSMAILNVFINFIQVLV